ncbi:MAG TPA: NADH-quinone oxidoreductase subunit C [Terriglobales bacterium]|nr:NADH-quinone oxidoreductase subunit C [Terriglobales bacterium]
MSEENKPTSASEEPDKECQGAEEPAPTPVAPAPAAPAPVAAAPAKPAAPAAPKPPAAPPKPAAPAPEPWNSELITALKRQYGSGIHEASSYLGQKYMVVDSSIAHEVLQILHDDESFDYCVDVTAVHYPKREKKEFDIIWILYSFATNERIRVKTQIADGATVKSVVSLWPTANWLEREVFDMFGIRFEGHPDLRRILLPDEWKGYPLRKDYGIKQQDQYWVQINVGIQSGQ